MRIRCGVGFLIFGFGEEVGGFFFAGVGEVGLEGGGGVVLFGEVALELVGVAVGGDDVVSAGFFDGLEELGPVDVVGEDEAAVGGAAASESADLHPAGGDGDGERGELADPRASG